MKTRITLPLLLSLVLAGGAHRAGAQGTAFTYQGCLANGTNATTGLYDFSFALYNAGSGGSQAGSTVTQTGVGVTNGQFTTQLDFGSQLNGTACWLQIGVRTNGAAAYTALGPRQPLTPTPYAITAENVNGTVLASQLAGTLPTSVLSGTYTSAVNLNNAANTFAGSGAGLASVNAAALNGLNVTNFWQLGGNNVAAGQFLGSTNNQSLELRVNNTRALLLDYTSGGGNLTVNPANNTIANATAGTIAGGTLNQIQSGANSALIGGGYDNQVQSNGLYAVIAGGSGNQIQGNPAQGTQRDFIGGGGNNIIEAYGYDSFIGGGYGNRIQSDDPGASQI